MEGASPCAGPTGQAQGSIEPQAAAIVDRLALQLGLDLKDEPQLVTRAAIVQHALARRGRLLVLLDDLWDVDLGRWLLAEALPAERVLLVTSRDLSVCRALCAHVERLGVLPEPEALELLANHLGDLAGCEDTARDVVRLLDGLPLALELAARLCDEGAADLPWLLDRLHRQPALDILRLEGRETRESCVEACLALSYERLSAGLQCRFRALGVFAPAPYDLAALAAVWSDKSIEDAEGVARMLVRRGLLVRAEDQLAAGEESPHPVYAQHSLLRAYALALLRRANEETTPAGRNADHYQTLAGEDWRAGERFWEQVEHGWGWAWAAGPERAQAFYYGLRRFLELRGRARPHIEWISSLLESPVEESERATLLNNIGRVYSSLGDKTRALQFYDQALPLRRQVGHRAGEATTLNNIGELHRSQGAMQLALEFYNQALPILRQVGDRRVEATTLNNIGLVYDALGDKPRALEFYDQALPLRRQVGDRAGEATTLNNIGELHRSQGATQLALEFYDQALPLSRQVGDRAGEATTLNNIGLVYSSLGDKTRALQFFDQALPLSRQVGDRWRESITRFNMAIVYRDLGRLDEAEEQLLQVVALDEALGHPDLESDRAVLVQVQAMRRARDGAP